MKLALLDVLLALLEGITIEVGCVRAMDARLEDIKRLRQTPVVIYVLKDSMLMKQG